MLFGRLDSIPAARRRATVAADLDVLLQRRARTLNSHPGQVSFPGGRSEAEDVDAAATALREAQEETGLDPSGVEVLASLPDLPLAASNHLVTPVLPGGGCCRRASLRSTTPRLWRCSGPGRAAARPRQPVHLDAEPRWRDRAGVRHRRHDRVGVSPPACWTACSRPPGGRSRDRPWSARSRWRRGRIVPLPCCRAADAVMP
jgi:8-oxo-dGTP pyrophosphatase MutT (NUDIX family)